MAAPDRTPRAALVTLLVVGVALAATWALSRAPDLAGPAGARHDPREPADGGERTDAHGSVRLSLGAGTLLLACSVGVQGGSVAHLERLTLGEGVDVEVLEEPASQVFHAARCDGRADGSFVTAAGMRASVQRWTRARDGHWAPRSLFEASYGPRSSRVRDLEFGAVLPGGGEALVIGTHDEGVVALIVPDEGGARITELDRSPATLAHEIELGDLDGDGVLEIYASLSPPNTLVAGIEQPGRVVRYVPALGRGRELVVDLAPRHAKELLATDLDADGRDELYLVVEGTTRRDGERDVLDRPVEIRRISATEPAPGHLVATLPDRLTRSLVAGDLDGDARRELYAGSFSAGLFRIDPVPGPGPWRPSVVDRGASGFEHAIAVTDLDADGRDELYVADDPRGELARYTWGEAGAERVVVHRWGPGTRITWGVSACAPATPIRGAAR